MIKCLQHQRSGLPPQEAPVMIAVGHSLLVACFLFLSLQHQ